ARDEKDTGSTEIGFRQQQIPVYQDGMYITSIRLTKDLGPYNGVVLTMEAPNHKFRVQLLRRGGTLEGLARHPTDEGLVSGQFSVGDKGEVKIDFSKTKFERAGADTIVFIGGLRRGKETLNNSYETITVKSVRGVTGKMETGEGYDWMPQW